MKTNISVGLLLFILTGCYTISFAQSSTAPSDDGSSCDKTKALSIIRHQNFNRIPKYDTVSFLPGSIYELSPKENRLLWYRDVQNPDSTRFTKFWDDYEAANYHADNKDFVDYFENKPEIEVAFQFGPNGDMWTYHIFIIRKLDHCYLITKSLFRHARFTHKAYSILKPSMVDSLFGILNSINKLPVVSSQIHGYCGYFADNRNKKTYYVNFDEEVDWIEVSSTISPFDGEIMAINKRVPKQEIVTLFDFVDDRIKWTTTYELNK